MSAWSALRRSQPLIHHFCRLNPRIQPLQIRNFSALPPPPPPLPFPPPPGGSTSTPFRRWLSGIIASSTFAVALYSYTSTYSSANFPSLSFADDGSVTPSKPTTITSSFVPVGTDDDLHTQPSQSKFLFGGDPIFLFSFFF